jgi:hypothetical protein
MPTWNTTYEAQPATGVNPGGGAQAIRGHKQAVRERMERGHHWGEDEGVVPGELGGQHKEGSARAFVLDGAEGGRTDMATPDVSSDAIGLLRFNTTPLTGVDRREQEGTYLDDLFEYTVRDQARRTIEVVSTDPIADPDTAVTTIYDYDWFVDTVQDQDIKGIKSFEVSPLLTEVVTIDDTYDVADVAKIPRAGEIHDYTHEAKYHNPFDPDLAENTAEGLMVDSIYPGKIAVDEIIAAKITGLVWL